MKHIAFLVGNLNNAGGTERVSTLVANELSNQSFKISILNLSGGDTPFFEVNSKISVYSLFSKKISMKANFFSAIWKIRQFVNSNKIDTLIVVDSISCIFTIPALFGLKTKHICWEHFNFINNNGSRLRDFARKLAAHYCDVVVTLTYRDQELWKKGIKKINANMITIPNPCTFKKTSNIPRLDYKVVLAVGRLTKVKGFDLLLEAWAKVCQHNHDWILRIVGDGEERESLQTLANNLSISDRIEFLGKVDNVDEYYKTSSFLCLSSRNEGLPMVMLEAQAFGLPIVAFDCDTGPAEIIKNGENGVLIENGDIQGLFLGLSKVIGFSELDYNQMVNYSYSKIVYFEINNIIDFWMNEV